jgi:hypothetical protein
VSLSLPAQRATTATPFHNLGKINDIFRRNDTVGVPFAPEGDNDMGRDSHDIVRLTYHRHFYSQTLTEARRQSRNEHERKVRSKEPNLCFCP